MKTKRHKHIAMFTFLKGFKNVMVGLIKNMVCTTSFDKVAKQHSINNEQKELIALFGS